MEESKGEMESKSNTIADFVDMCNQRKKDGKDLHSKVEEKYNIVMAQYDKLKDMGGANFIEIFKKHHASNTVNVPGFASARASSIPKAPPIRERAGGRGIYNDPPNILVYQKRDDKCCLAAVKIKNRDNRAHKGQKKKYVVMPYDSVKGHL